MDIKNINFIKIENHENGLIEGYASVFDVIDQHNDIIKPGAFKKVKLKELKLLWQHNPEILIGKIESIVPLNVNVPSP